MTSREMIEFMSKGSAGVIDSTNNYHWCRVLNRFEMYVNRDDKSVSPHLINDGFWESWITKWVIDNVGPQTFFIDIGANTGYYSFLAADLGAMVQAFEPNPTYHDMIRHTMIRTGKRFFLEDAALSDYTGEAVLHIPTELHGSASLSEIIPGYETKNIPVRVKPLDDIMSYSDYPTVIKIDAEGEEERILRGAKDFIDMTADLVVLLEYTPGAYSADFVDHLFDNYHVTWINTQGHEERVFIPWLEAQTDWVMLVLR